MPDTIYIFKNQNGYVVIPKDKITDIRTSVINDKIIIVNNHAVFCRFDDFIQIWRNRSGVVYVENPFKDDNI